jgi:methylglutaconyl-CoA hydratase
MYQYTTLNVECKEGTAQVVLNRPDVYNAFNETVIDELTHCFSHLSGDDAVHAVVFTGAGRHFCAGADLNWMKKTASYTREENIADSKKMGDMFEIITTCSKPVVGRINGSAFGGGVGLVAVCDVVVCSENALFAFSEVKLGIVPAVISSYVLPKIGVSHARSLFVTGERFGAQKAYEIGLVHTVCPQEELDTHTEKVTTLLKSSGPQAVKAAKTLIQTWSVHTRDEFRKYTEELIADLRASEEGKEGITAFLEKRKPVWR